jgi:hypothetical protein
VLLADGIDPAFIRPRPAPDHLRGQLGLVGKRVVLYLGVLTEYQGIDDLLLAWPQVMAAVPDAHLLIVGHPNVEHYRARAAELTPPGSVTLTGRVDYDKTPEYLALGDIGVSAKHVSTEANGKLLNYMAMGLPAVAYDGPVSRELLGEAGVFAPMRDVPALAAALAGLLRDPHEQKLRGQALRERVVTHFGWPARRRLVDVYRTCLEGDSLPRFGAARRSPFSAVLPSASPSPRRSSTISTTLPCAAVPAPGLRAGRRPGDYPSSTTPLARQIALAGASFLRDPYQFASTAPAEPPSIFLPAAP